MKIRTFIVSLTLTELRTLLEVLPNPESKLYTKLKAMERDAEVIEGICNGNLRKQDTI